jgi:hypothetical protein
VDDAEIRRLRDVARQIPPGDVTTPLDEGSAQLHELFTSYRRAGFTEWQACSILGIWLGFPKGNE